MRYINTLFINSAVAFFFLFFLHGTSIGTRQQGISYNVKNNRSLPMRLRRFGKLRLLIVSSRFFIHKLKIKNMFSYYGRKSKIVKHYPKPIYDKIIEPFAGSAAYSMVYFEKDVLLIEKYDVLVKLWDWLINEATEKEILALPSVVENDMINKFDWLCQEEKWLMGLSLNRGSAQPKNKVKKFSDGWENVKKRIANDLHKIRHWKVIEGDYRDINNEEATWFIDPPYQYGGQWYKHKNIDYKELNSYCKSRNGQIIVCENTKADWIELTALVKIQGSVNSNTTEAIWSNHKTDYGNVQQSLF